VGGGGVLVCVRGTATGQGGQHKTCASMLYASCESHVLAWAFSLAPGASGATAAPIQCRIFQLVKPGLCFAVLCHAVQGTGIFKRLGALRAL
jgi:hypothetical protein